MCIQFTHHVSCLSILEFISLHGHFTVDIIVPSFGSSSSVSPSPKTPLSGKNPVRPRTPPRPPITKDKQVADDSQRIKSATTLLLPKDEKDTSSHFLFPRKTNTPEIKLVKQEQGKRAKPSDRRNACTILKVPQPDTISKDGLVYGMFSDIHSLISCSNIRSVLYIFKEVVVLICQ